MDEDEARELFDEAERCRPKRCETRCSMHPLCPYCSDCWWLMLFAAYGRSVAGVRFPFFDVGFDGALVRTDLESLLITPAARG